MLCVGRRFYRETVVGAPRLEEGFEEWHRVP
jgi:hypothetical protein